MTKASTTDAWRSGEKAAGTSFAFSKRVLPTLLEATVRDSRGLALKVTSSPLRRNFLLSGIVRRKVRVGKG